MRKNVFHVFVVHAGAKLEQLMEQLRSELESTPPLPGAYTPRTGDLCAAQFVDNQWYRAKIEKVSSTGVTIYYIDYGNVSVFITLHVFWGFDFVSRVNNKFLRMT